MESAKIYETYKPLLFSIAYRMTGSVMDAEDLVHEAFLKFNSLRVEKDIENQRAYLCKILINKCIDQLRSNGHIRENYVGEWLPEPFIDDNLNPEESFMMKESISTAYLLLLQQLSETERAVFLLREVFQWNYDEISEIVEKSAVNCRQIYHRSKKSIDGSLSKNHLNLQDMKAKIDQFTIALQNGNILELLELIKNDAVYIADGGGKRVAATRPIYSAQRIIQFFAGILKNLPDDYRLEYKVVNGKPGIVISVNHYVAYVLSFDFVGEQISRIYMVVNPEKLEHLQK